MLRQLVRKHKSKDLRPAAGASRAHGGGSAPWPVAQQRQRVRWFPSQQRLIGLVRAEADSFVLPPAIVRKAAWRD